ncbi:MAG: DUF5674 family protein [Candidatus Babeliales bacterium]
MQLVDTQPSFIRVYGLGKLRRAGGPISVSELEEIGKIFNSLVKAVVDVEEETMVVDMEMHADGEFFMLKSQESAQENLWGINLLSEKYGTPEFIEYAALMNIRQSHKSWIVEDIIVRTKIEKIVTSCIAKG